MLPKFSSLRSYPVTRVDAGFRNRSDLGSLTRRIRHEMRGAYEKQLNGAFDTTFTNLIFDPYGKSHTCMSEGKWDVASRSTRNIGSNADAVVVLARLKLADERVLLVKQYRPPLDAVSIELPAGLVDSGESVEHAALRELKEETGFVGNVVKMHKAASLSPGMSTETVVLVEVVIEGAGERQTCEPGENIEVVSVPLARFEEAVEYIARTENTVVMHAVTTLGVGLRIGAMCGK